MKKLTVEQYIESINTYRRHGTLGEESLDLMQQALIDAMDYLHNKEQRTLSIKPMYVEWYSKCYNQALVACENSYKMKREW